MSLFILYQGVAFMPSDTNIKRLKVQYVYNPCDGIDYLNAMIINTVLILLFPLSNFKRHNELRRVLIYYRDRTTSVSQLGAQTTHYATV